MINTSVANQAAHQRKGSLDGEELLKYLNSHFYTEAQLLSITLVGEQDFKRYQHAEILPQPSYSLAMSLTSDSYFGEHTGHSTIRYYAKGYASWIGLLQTNSDVERVRGIFDTRYLLALDALEARGFVCEHLRKGNKLQEHLDEEWSYFVDGTYGLCTKSGLPEDIAAKEISISTIKELIDDSAQVKGENKILLKKAVDLLDKTSANFAPHERLESSRYRYVDLVRREFSLA